MKVHIGESARWQIRAAIETLLKRDRAAANGFRDELARLLAAPATLAEEATTLSDFPELPIREVVSHGYRIFLWVRGDAMWIGGVWDALRA